MRPEQDELSPWRDNLQWVAERLEDIKERKALPRDGTDLAKALREQAALASLFPDTSQLMEESVRAAAGAAAASALLASRGRYWEGGSVLLEGPGGWDRHIPDGTTSFYLPDWIDGFACATIAGDREALSILCAPDCIDACTGPPKLFDRFWHPLCSALACAVADPEAADRWVGDAERFLPESRNAEPELVDLYIAPVLGTVRAIAARDALSTQEGLDAALRGHREYYDTGHRQTDPFGMIAPWVLALATIARQEGLPAQLEGAECPVALQELHTTKTRWATTYCYPTLRIIAQEEPRWFLDVSGFEREGREHSVFDVAGHPVARYEARGAPGVPRGRIDFVPSDKTEVPTALDAGELLELARWFEQTAVDPAHQTARRTCLEEAMACVNAVLARIPEGEEAVPSENLLSPESRAIHDEDPRQLERGSLMAYREALGMQRSPK